jgi:type IV secretion system protein TrbB
VHANSARRALYRLEQLIQEAVVTDPRHLIAHAVDILEFIVGRGAERQIQTVVEVQGLGADGEYILATPPAILNRRAEA